MDEITLITTARGGLNAAETAFRYGNHEEYATHMCHLLDLLVDELAGSAPRTPEEPPPERTRL